MKYKVKQKLEDRVMVDCLVIGEPSRTINNNMLMQLSCPAGDLKEGDVIEVFEDSSGIITKIERIQAETTPENMPEKPITTPPPKTTYKTKVLPKEEVRKDVWDFRYIDNENTKQSLTEGMIKLHHLEGIREGDEIEVCVVKTSRGYLTNSIKNLTKTPEQTTDNRNAIKPTTYRPPTEIPPAEDTSKKIFKSGNVYRIGNKEIADAMLTQQYANEKGVSTYLKEKPDVRLFPNEKLKKYFDLDDMQVIAIAVSKKDNVEVEACCELTLSIEIKCRLMEKQEKARREHRKTPDYEDFISEAYRIRTFIVRSAETKAEERSQKKILNQEFRDEEEIESEDSEVEMVNDGGGWK